MIEYGLNDYVYTNIKFPLAFFSTPESLDEEFGSHEYPSDVNSSESLSLTASQKSASETSSSSELPPLKQIKLTEATPTGSSSIRQTRLSDVISSHSSAMTPGCSRDATVVDSEDVIIQDLQDTTGLSMTPAAEARENLLNLCQNLSMLAVNRINEFWSQTTYSGRKFELHDLRCDVSDKIKICAKCQGCGKYISLNIVQQKRLSIKNYKHHASTHVSHVAKGVKNIKPRNVDTQLTGNKENTFATHWHLRDEKGSRVDNISMIVNLYRKDHSGKLSFHRTVIEPINIQCFISHVEPKELYEMLG